MQQRTSKYHWPQDVESIIDTLGDRAPIILPVEWLAARSCDLNCTLDLLLEIVPHLPFIDVVTICCESRLFLDFGRIRLFG
jgi:hypothetical protein